MVVTAPDRDRLLGLLAGRKGMTDFELFVGRQHSLSLLSGCTRTHDQSAWLHGARRTGKTSLARRVEQIAKANGARTAWVDATTTRGDFDPLLARVVRRAAGTDGAAAGDPRVEFERLAATADDEPLVVLFDEFDETATRLGQAEQGFLRALTQEHPKLCYVFVTRFHPDAILEPVDDRYSQLKLICNVVQVKPFERQDVHELCRRVAATPGLGDVRCLADSVWQVVGGYPIAVMALVHEVAAQIIGGARPGWSIHDSDALETFRESIDPLLDSYWKDLHPATRGQLLGLASDGSHAYVARDGFENGGSVVKPTWLVERGRVAGITPSPENSDVSPWPTIEEIYSLVYEINTNLLRLGLTRGFETTHEFLRLYELTRPVSCQSDMERVAQFLWKVLYEGSRRPGRHGAPDEWRLPDALRDPWKKTLAYEAMTELRHQGVHDRSRESDSIRANRHFAAVGDVLRRLCGCANPSGAGAWSLVRDRMLVEMVQSLRQMRTHSVELVGTVAPA